MTLAGTTTAGRLIAAALVAGVTGCVTPAPSTQVYEAKAGLTAKDALSQLETARQAVEAAVSGRLTEGYLETVLSTSEDDFTAIQGTFDSVQPPASRQADALRNSLDELLSAGADGLARMRIVARRGQTPTLAAIARSLGRVSRSLDSFATEHAK